jgi:hypothetical protein
MMITYAEELSATEQRPSVIDEVIGNRHFDLSRRWLPVRLSGADRVACLTPAEKVKLTHVELGAYAHLFACLEEFIAPTMKTVARGLEQDDRAAADALDTCAATELKHMNLFREIRARVDAALGLPLTLLPDAQKIVGVVLSRHPAAVLLLTAAIEWLSQQHYLTCFVDDTALDPLTRHIFESHWREESRHARLEHAETLRAFRGLTLAEQEQAIDDFIDLITGMEGLLHIQARLDVENLQRCIWRRLEKSEQAEILAAVLAAKRDTFVEGGLTHPNFQELLRMVTTPEQQQKVRQALGAALTTSV